MQLYVDLYQQIRNIDDSKVG